MDHIEETVRRGTRVVDETGETQGGRRPDDQRGLSTSGAVSETSAMSGATGAVAHVNEIVLIGRLSGVPEWKALPGGGQVAVWRLIVEHQDARSPQDAIDTIRCITYDPSLQPGVRDWRHGDVIEVRGALRHRFWRGPAGPRGLYEVEATVAIRRHHAERGGGDRK
ncbi:single-stranded DNA-binding protein [Actinoallomurus purpureus]|uniref:single-stranded DNA-binding protein n=1 Tax=Actinoallomurus purpureus TaxID=478114 RepID=UPI002092F11C|nr:single-stranded DNA-binding protein [Actinoallomurus purpureus]MCO6007964.1 single-stranded DNA-binding protein [Actinoallomurus purpureus]